MEVKWLYNFSSGVRHAFEIRGDGHTYQRSVCGMAFSENSEESRPNPLHECNQCKRILNGMPMKPRKTPWQKIRDAADRGTPCHLTADDVLRLSQDAAIMWRAEQDDEGED